jgi:hypothetical protein
LAFSGRICPRKDIARYRSERLDPMEERTTHHGEGGRIMEKELNHGRMARATVFHVWSSAYRVMCVQYILHGANFLLRRTAGDEQRWRSKVYLNEGGRTGKEEEARQINQKRYPFSL